MYHFVQDGCSLREDGRGLKSGQIPSPLCLASTSCCFHGMRPVPTGCLVCMGWASDAAEMLGQSYLEMWWKLSTSACAAWRAGHADRGMARVKAVPIGFYSRGFFTVLWCFPSLWELWKLVTQPWTIDGSWPAAWMENGWRERWRRVVFKLKEIEFLGGGRLVSRW